MKALFLSIMIIFAVCITVSAGLAEDAFAKQIQVVTARGNVFSLVDSEVGWMNNGTGGTTIITNVINNTTVINNTGAGVGFGYLPQIVIHDTPGAMMLWGNSTHAGHGAERPYMREGTLDFAGIVKQDDRSVTIPLPAFSGEYRLQGEDRLTGSNDIIEDTYSSWDNTGGWLELTGDSTIGGPNTAVARLQDYQFTRQPINITGWASPGTTVSIVSSPNDLTQHTVVGEEFAQETVPFDSYPTSDKVLYNTAYSSSSNRLQSDILADLLECRDGKTDGHTRGYRCHNFAYQSYPVDMYVDFYAKSCGAVVDSVTGRANVTYGNINHPSSNYEYTATSTALSPPVIECGSITDGYHHVTKISQNKTSTHSETYRFDSSNGMLEGTHVVEDLFHEIHGNLTLNTSDHDVHFTGTGLFEETVDARPLTYTPTTVMFTARISHTGGNNGVFANLSLEIPDGQTIDLARHSFLYSGIPSRTITETIEFHDIQINGDWTLHASSSYCRLDRPFSLGTWTLTINGVDFTGSGGRINCATTRTITASNIPNSAPTTLYNNDLYLMATGMTSDDNIVRIRGTDVVDPAQLIIRNMDPYTPYQITDNGAPIKIGMASRSGVIEIPRGEVDISMLNGPIVLTYWPDATTYDGYAHTSNEGIMFDPYNDEVVEFPWETNDPLLYVAKAYVKMTFPVDGTKLDGARISGDRGSVTYAYARGTYDAGDEVFIPIFPGARTIHLQINGEWVQSYIKDVQQNSAAVTFDSNRGDRTTASATMFATKPGVAIALVSADLGTSSSAYLITNVVDPGDGRRGSATYSECSTWPAYVSSKTSDLWQYKAAVTRSLGSAGGGSATLFVEVYHNGEYVQTVNGTTSGVSGYATRGLFSDEAEPPPPYTNPYDEPGVYQPTNIQYSHQGVW